MSAVMTSLTLEDDSTAQSVHPASVAGTTQLPVGQKVSFVDTASPRTSGSSDAEPAAVPSPSRSPGGADGMCPDANCSSPRSRPGRCTPPPKSPQSPRSQTSRGSSPDLDIASIKRTFKTPKRGRGCAVLDWRPTPVATRRGAGDSGRRCPRSRPVVLDSSDEDSESDQPSRGATPSRGVTPRRIRGRRVVVDSSDDESVGEGDDQAARKRPVRRTASPASCGSDSACSLADFIAPDDDDGATTCASSDESEWCASDASDEGTCEDSPCKRAPVAPPCLPPRTPRAAKPFLKKGPLPRSTAPALHTPRKFAALRQQLTKAAFQEFNAAVFDSKLPGDMEVTWNARLLKTAGVTKMARLSGGVREATIELSVKVLDCHERLRTVRCCFARAAMTTPTVPPSLTPTWGFPQTLLHEMCHAAAWLIDGVSRPPHGRVFKYEAVVRIRACRVARVTGVGCLPQIVGASRHACVP